MDLIKLIEYKNWADEIYINYCEKLSPAEYDHEIEGYNNNIKKILGHLYEVSWFWFRFITDKNYEKAPDLENINIQEIFKGLREYNVKFLHYISENGVSKIHDLQWIETDKLVKTTSENIIFNFITHSAYHRGQLAIYLRLTGIKTITETDFNPYVYLQGQK